MMQPFIKHFLISSLFSFLSITILGQSIILSLNTNVNDISNWTYGDYINNHIEKVTAYSYKISKNGKPKKDSSLLYSREITKDSNKIFGIISISFVQPHKPLSMSLFKFEEKYNNKNQVLREFTEPVNIVKKVEYGSTEYYITQEETLYEYDNSNRLIKKTYTPYNNYYSISKYTKDTFHLLSIQKKIDEYVYNEKGLEIFNYHSVDSMRYLPTERYKTDSNSVTCSYCHSRYLNQDKTYNENGKLKVWTWYNTDGRTHTKKYYYYDDNSNLIKQVDSTGWYFTIPYLESTTFYEYSDTGKIVTKINNTEVRFGSTAKKIITKYNLNNQITSECSFTDSTESCSKYFYTYDKDKLKSITFIDNESNKSEIHFIYNTRGMLFEKKELLNNKLKRLTKYYYSFASTHPL